MCGRYTLTKLPVNETLVNTEGEILEWEPRYNIAPTNLCPVKSMHHPDVAMLYRWGLIPFWANDAKVGYRMINARAETLSEKPAFRNAFVRGRCIVYADGFYEWKKEASAKQPYRIIRKDQKPFMMAGLTESWQAPDGATIFSFTIITTKPNALTVQVHDRMPVILDNTAVTHWLDPEISSTSLKHLLEPFPADAMDIYPVDKAVGNVRNDFAGLIEHKL